MRTRPLTQPTVLALTGVCVLGACQEPRRATSDRVALYLADAAERRIDTRDVRIEPADNVRAAQVDARGWIAIERIDDTRALHITAPNFCPVSIAAGPQREAQALEPALELGGDRTGIGFGTRFSVRARHNCAQHERGEIHWQQLEGPPLADLQVSDAGFTLHARSASFEQAHPEPVSQGIVPIAPRTQGRVVLQASWRASSSPPTTRNLVITAAARATGLSSVAVSQPLVLAGTGWEVKARPPGGRASLKALEGLTFFTADAPGSWTLARAEGEVLKLQSLTHDATPYDCGRAECHAALSEHTAASAMSHALEWPLAVVEHSDAVSCMLDCHVLGERGVSDGGFQALAARLGFTWTEHTRWQDLPQALRRAGGVRCTACHGPGAIPPPEQRSAILESDVCATCHDAPPRYVHVTQWRSGRMASSDRDPATRGAPCNSCHTTAGFLAHNGARKMSHEQPRREPTGISCAACHAPHSDNRGPRLIRNVDAPEGAAGELFAEPASVLCRSCHAQTPKALPSIASAQGAASPTPTNASAWPQALAAAEYIAAPSGALYGSEIAVPARSGEGWELVRARSAHEQVPRGCIGCHGGAALARNAVDHSFRAEPRVCATCHAGDAARAGRAPAQALHSRALALSRALAPHCETSDAQLAHAQPARARCRNRELERARYETNLVLDDNAALFHNAELARALLDDAEQIVSVFRGL